VTSIYLDKSRRVAKRQHSHRDEEILVEHQDFDVIVVGGGGAGLAAAIEGKNAGASVLICEAGSQLGGSTGVAGGLFLAADTALQKAQGVTDTADDFYDYIMMMNRWELEAAVARRYAEESGPTIAWMQDLGIEFEPYVHPVALSAVPRGHLPKEYGFGIIKAMSSAINKARIETALKVRIQKLLTDENGGVVGVEADGVEVRAKSVVVTCGGLGAADHELLKEYWPDAAQFEDGWHYYIGVDTVRGDALALGKNVNAEIAGINCGLVINSSSYFRDPEGIFPGWPVYVNTRGRRFINEMADYSIMAENMNRQPGKVIFVVMDHDAFARDLTDPRYVHRAIHPDIVAGSLNPAALAEGLARGEVIQADTIEELAEKAGIDRSVLAATIAEYNDDVDKGRDSHFLKDPETMVKIQTPPFYAAPRRAAQLSTSAVGLHINADAQVYSTLGGYVPGLYAAGEASSGPWNHYTGSGSSIGTAMTFGRIAGRSAAAQLSGPK
jgi:fumarate reductase flavoprotein subunit